MSNPFAARKLTTIVPLALAGVALLAVPVAPGASAAVALIAFAVMMLTSSVQSCWATIHELVPEARVGGVSGFIHLLSNISGIVGPTATGLAVEYLGGYSSAFVVAAVIAGAGVVAMAVFVKPDADHPYRRVALAGRNQNGTAQPGDGKVISDELAPASNRFDPGQTGWQNVWYGQLRTNSALGADVERSDLHLELAYPVLSLLDRLPPMPDYKANSSTTLNPVFDQTRTDLLARGARMLDAGPSLAAGQLLVLATVKGPLPIPVQVDGDPMAGDGTTLYQFLLPIDRSAVDKPPATQPAAK